MTNKEEENCCVVLATNAQIIFRGTREECEEYLLDNARETSSLLTLICYMDKDILNE